MTITLETPDTWPGSESPTNPSGERRNVLTVNGVEPDNDGNVVVEGGGVSLADRVAAGESFVFWGLDNGANLPGAVLQAKIDAYIAEGVPESAISWYSTGTEAAGATSASMGVLALAASATLSLSALSGVRIGSMGTLSFTAPATLALGTLAGVEVSEGSASLGNLSLAAPSTLSLGTLSGVQNGDMGALGLTAGATLTLGTLAGVENSGAVNASMGALALTASSTLALGTLAGTAPPTAPVVISVTPGDTQNVIALTSGGVGATSYNLKWGTVAGTRSNEIVGVTLPYTHTGLTNGTTYYYSVVAVNGAGSTESAEVSGVPVAASANYYTQGWESATNFATSYDGWTSGISGTNAGRYVLENSLLAYEGNKSFMLSGGDTGSEGTAWLERTMTIAAGTLTFGHIHDGDSPEPTYTKVYIDGVQVGVTYSTDGLKTITIPSGSVIRFSMTSLAGSAHIDAISIPIP